MTGITRFERELDLLCEYLHPLLGKLKISQKGFHAFRHGNTTALTRLGVPVSVIDDRQGRKSRGLLTLDVYTHTEFDQNREAADRLAAALKKELDSVTVSAPKLEELPARQPEALEKSA